MAVNILVVIVLIHQLHTIHSAPLSSYLVSSFIGPDPTLPFNLITTYNVTGDIYIGADRRLYQLYSNLTLKQTVAVGSCSGSSDDSPNENRLLVVAPSPVEKLILCWSCDAYCETRSLDDVTADYERHSHNGNAAVADPDVQLVATVGMVGSDSNTMSMFTGQSSNDYSWVRPVKRHALPDLNLEYFIDGYNPVNIYKREYIKIINFQKYVFFLIKRLTRSQSRHAYLGRLCTETNDLNLESYTEIQLQCVGDLAHNVIRAVHIGPAGVSLAHSLGISRDEHVLYAVFTEDEASTGRSALCIYSMGDIQQSFTNAVAGCISQGSGYTNPYLVGTSCGMFPSADPTAFECNAILYGGYPTLYAYPAGVHPPVAPVLTWTGSTPTSIITTTERDNTIAVVGSRGGDMMKIHIKNNSSANIYETVHLGIGSVLRDMFVHEEQEEITLALNSSEMASENKVLRLSLANCSQYQTCEECTGVGEGFLGDPYCGWCTLEARCSRFDDCPLSNESSRWLSVNSLECVNISEIQPSNSLPYGMNEQHISLTVEQLPDLRASYQYTCVFDHDDVMSYISPASTNGIVISCVTPPANYVPPIPEGDDHVTFELSIVATETGVAFVSRELFFYDCSKIQSCFRCVSRWPCDWCVYDNRCTDGSNSCHTDDVIVTLEMGLESCPQLLSVSGEPLIPVGVPSGFSLIAKNLPTKESQVRGYICILHIEEEEYTTGGFPVNSSLIICDPRQYAYKEDVLTTNISVAVRWNSVNTVGSRDDPKVTLYKCSLNGGSCSRCLSPDATPPELQCMWCGDACNVIESGVCQSSGTSLNQDMSRLCSAPVITSFDPNSGPLEGNTTIEIIGTDLGVRFEDITRISVAGLPCDLTGMERYYQPGLSTRCRTRSGHAGTAGIIEIDVMTGDLTKNGRSNEMFIFTDPRITGFFPKEGQVAGGTRVTIFGEHLDTGREQRAWFGDYECRDLTTDGNISCVTTAVNQASSFVLTMVFDGLALRESTDRFSFMPNPVIDLIRDRNTMSSGGLMIEVIGTGFKLIHEARLWVTSYSSGAANSERCNIVDDARMECPSPGDPNKRVLRRRRSTNGLSVASLTFVMDSLIINGGNMTYYPDPVYFNINASNNIARIDVSKQLVLNGSNLDLVSTRDDVQVLVGTDGVCKILLFDLASLLCLLPDIQPDAVSTGGTSRELPAIQVIHGNLQFYPGFVEYDHGSSDSPVLIIVLVSLGVIVVVIVAVVAGILWLRSRQNLEHMEQEIEMVRQKVERARKVVKTSLDLSGVDSRVKKYGVPFIDLAQYVTVVLFNGLGDPQYTGQMEKVMEPSVLSFQHKLNQVDFLVEYISQLEIKKHGDRKSKELIASLLAITLANDGNAILLTDLVMLLVKNKIQSIAGSGRRLDQVFSRSENIVDYLLIKWMALFMYPLVKSRVIYQLYTLYHAVKIQSEKGPIDGIDGECYFTLVYDSLLDREVQFQTLALFIVDEDNKVYMTVEVLDVDNLQQVKMKIMDAIWYGGLCLLPRDADAVVLVWMKDYGNTVVLQDYDHVTDQNTTRLNTMKTYGIDSGCRIALVDKQAVSTDAYLSLDIKTISSNQYQSLGLTTASQPKVASPQQIIGNAFHLKERNTEHVRQDRTGQEVLDRYLAIPRMLTMKVAIDPYLESVLDVILKTPSVTPLPVRSFFHTLDDLAVQYGGGTEKQFANKWKRDCLSHLWMPLLGSLPSLFEMPRSSTADDCIAVVVAALDAAVKDKKADEEQRGRLPYERDFPVQSIMVASYLDDLANMPKVRPPKLNRACTNIAKEYRERLSHMSPLQHLFELTHHDVRDLLQSRDPGDE